MLAVLIVTSTHFPRRRIGLAVRSADGFLTTAAAVGRALDEPRTAIEPARFESSETTECDMPVHAGRVDRPRSRPYFARHDLGISSLAVHLAIIAFNLFGLIAIPLGAHRKWAFVRAVVASVAHRVLERRRDAGCGRPRSPRSTSLFSPTTWRCSGLCRPVGRRTSYYKTRRRGCCRIYMIVGSQPVAPAVLARWSPTLMRYAPVRAADTRTANLGGDERHASTGLMPE